MVAPTPTSIFSFFSGETPQARYQLDLFTARDLWFTCKLTSVSFYVATQLGAFDAVVKQMLEDVQERLVYRTHIYIQTDITGYNPAPGDLAYPEKLEMMEVCPSVKIMLKYHRIG